MTILVAVKKNGRVFLGADRITTFGSEYVTDLVDGSKIMKLKHGYLATSGYTLMDNIVEHLFSTNHKIIENKFSNRYEVFSFFLELYSELKKSYTLIDTGKDTYAGIYNTFIIVTPHSIYGVSNNLSVHEYEHYTAKGSGSDYSLGLLYGLYDTLDDGHELVRLALQSACHYNIYCKEPLDILEVKQSDFEKKGRTYKDLGTGVKVIQSPRRPGDLLSTGRKSTAARNGAKSKASAKAAAKAVKTGAAKKKASKRK